MAKFLEITNQDIYNKIVRIEKKLDDHMDSANKRLEKIEQQITWHQLIGGFFITTLVGFGAWVINKMIGGK